MTYTALHVDAVICSLTVQGQYSRQEAMFAGAQNAKLGLVVHR